MDLTKPVLSLGKPNKNPNLGIGNEESQNAIKALAFLFPLSTRRQRVLEEAILEQQLEATEANG